MTLAEPVGRMPRKAPPAPARHILMGQVRAWQELKLLYPELHRREVAHVEEGYRASRVGWPGS